MALLLDSNVSHLLVSPREGAMPDGLAVSPDGRRLYVVQNQLNLVAVVSLRPGLLSGRVLTRLSDPDFSVPTTIDDRISPSGTTPAPRSHCRSRAAKRRRVCECVHHP
jgi:DNA-binding beta-propeller fold protein YncE